MLAQVTSRAKEIAVGKLASSTDANITEIGNADGFKIYVTVGKTLHVQRYRLHENLRDVFMLVLT